MALVTTIYHLEKGSRGFVLIHLLTSADQLQGAHVKLNIEVYKLHRQLVFVCPGENNGTCIFQFFRVLFNGLPVLLINGCRQMFQQYLDVFHVHYEALLVLDKIMFLLWQLYFGLLLFGRNNLLFQPSCFLFTATKHTHNQNNYNNKFMHFRVFRGYNEILKDKIQSRILNVFLQKINRNGWL